MILKRTFTPKMKQQLYLLDAYALIYRAYYAFIRAPRRDSSGRDTSAIFGFVLTLQDLLEKANPDLLGVVFDPSGGTFRHREYPEYKAQREETPQGITFAIPYIKKLLEAYRIPSVEVADFEADDVIGTLAGQAEAAGYEVRMVTPDKDYGQLVTEHSKMYKPSKNGGGYELWGPAEVASSMDLSGPEQVIDYLGLMGDSSDNIPGCKGIGPKTASTLLKEWGSIDNIYQHLDEIKPATAKKLREGKESTLLSRYLATIRTDAPITFRAEDFTRREINIPELISLFEELEFRSLSKRVLGQRVAKTEKVIQQDLFADEESLQSSTLSEGNTLFPHLSDYLDAQPNYRRIETPEALNQLWGKLSKQTAFAFDTETTDVDPLKAEIVGISFSWEAKEGYYIPLPENEKEVRQMLRPLKRLLDDNKHLKVGQNLKYDLQVLDRYDIRGRGPYFDTMIAHYVLEPDSRHGMDYLAETLLSYRTISYDELMTTATRKGDIRTTNPERLTLYAAEDADVTWQLYQKLLPLFEQEETVNLLNLIEMPLMPVLAQMEREGVRLDTCVLEELADEIAGRIQLREEKIQEMAGEPFNVNSPKQVGEILFDKLQLMDRPKKTKTGVYSTAEETLQKIRSTHPIVPLILDYRADRKLLNTYIEPLPSMLHSDGRLHTSYNQCVTSTGRLSSSNPNLQNIPIRTEDGRGIRRAFVARSDEYTFLSADYSQIELRLMAHLSGDPGLIEAFREGKDIHTATAAKIYGINTEQVSSDQRRKAKTANFGIIYGISAFGLAERLDIPRGEAKSLIDGYFNLYPQVKEYMEAAIAEAKKLGYVSTLFGRRRYLPDINSRNATVRSFAERNAINAPIQGTAADIIKLAMIRIAKAIEEQELRSRMILQVHDELNFDVFKPELEQVSQIVRMEMEQVFPELSVPLVADIGYGRNWLEAH